jgi:3,4-dihydroxy 2-butanone 4-phosphate synthase/GTP cyclohydrolase II
MSGSSVNIQRIAEFRRPTVFGEFNIINYNKDGQYLFAITNGDLPQANLTVRVQSACLFGESFGVNSCDCAAQLQEALRYGAQNTPFLLVYMTNQEGRGLGMFQKIKAIEEEAVGQVDMGVAFERLNLPFDLREYHVAAEIIRDINGDLPIRLMTNNPKKVTGLEENGITVIERIPLLIDPPHEAARVYMSVKKNKMGHILPHIA